MLTYRICRAPYRALDGEGARLYGGRWNSPGRPVVYTSSTLALAALEYLIHIDAADAPADLVALTIDIPDTLAVTHVDAAALSPGWEQVATPAVCQEIGDRWLNAGVTPLLRVPAAPIPEEVNLLIDPHHPAARDVAVLAERPFFFDPRLL